MSLQGVLSDFGVADVFQLIAQQRKTGVLELERAGRSLEVHFVNGAVLRARPTEARPDGALASFLLRTGALSESALAEVVKQQEETLESLPRLLRVGPPPLPIVRVQPDRPGGHRDRQPRGDSHRRCRSSVLYHRDGRGDGTDHRGVEFHHTAPVLCQPGGQHPAARR